MRITETQLFHKQSETDKFLFILYDYDNISLKKVTDIYCYLVNNVTTVTFVTYEKNNSNKNNTDNKVTANAKVYFSRFLTQNKITINKENRPNTYSLTIETRRSLKILYERYEAEKEAAQKLAKEQEQEIMIPKNWEEYLLTEDEKGAKIIDKNIKEESFNLDYETLISYNPELAFLLEENAEEQLNTIKKILNEYYQPKKINNIIIKGFRDKQKIARIRAAQYGRLINIHCEICAKGELYDRAHTIKYHCLGCGTTTIVLQNLESTTIQRTKICPKCAWKGSFKEEADEVFTAQATTIQEISELLKPGEQPRRLPCLLIGSLAEKNSEQLNIGDRVTLTGYYIRQREPRTADYKRIFIIVGAEALAEDITKLKITDEIKQLIQKIRLDGDPLKKLSSMIFERVEGHDLAKELLTLQGFGRIHILLLGEPGLGKTELSKCSVQAFPRSEFFQSTNASRAGLTGAASKDNHTGRFVLEMNGISRLHPHGVAVIDEINRAGEDILESLLGVMQDRMLKIRKTNVQSDLPCDISLLATANPKGDLIDCNKSLWEQVQIPKALFDRFSFTLMFAQDISKYESFKVFFKKGLEQMNDLDINLRLAIREMTRLGWEEEVVVSGDDSLDKMDFFMKEIVVPHKAIYGESLRLTRIIPSVLEALCRLTGNKTPGQYEFSKLEELLRLLRVNHQEATMCATNRESGVICL